MPTGSSVFGFRCGVIDVGSKSTGNAKLVLGERSQCSWPRDCGYFCFISYRLRIASATNFRCEMVRVKSSRDGLEHGTPEAYPRLPNVGGLLEPRTRPE